MTIPDAVPDGAAADHTGQFIAMLDAAFRRQGASEGLPPPIRDAVAATPRHRFVHRFRIGDGPLRDADADADTAQAMPDIYSDQVMRHVDAAGALLPSSNSQPSYILFLLHLLGLAPGQAVLEIGSGSGWLAAVMARLVGPTGRVTGIELIPDLAAQSRADLAAAGLGNVTVVTGDGTLGYAAEAPYDRAIVTAGAWDVPAALLDQVVEGGRVLVPVERRGGDGCDVTVFRKRGGALVAEHAVPGWFVPLYGSGQNRAAAGPTPESLPFWDEVVGSRTVRGDLPLTVLPGGAAPAAVQFKAFLGRTEAGLVISSPDRASWAPGAAAPPFGPPVAPFGLVDRTDRSVALWEAGRIVCYGGTAAAARLVRAYARWAGLGLPGLAAFQLEVHRVGIAPAADDRSWVDARSETALVWRLRDGVVGWRGLLASDDGLDDGANGRLGKRLGE